MSRYQKNEKKWLEDNQHNYKGYPILFEYRYLGTILNEKLSIHSQVKFIKSKAFFIGNKLMPLLRCSSLESRYNLWQIFISPLFEYLIPLLSAEEYITHQNNVERLQRSTFRQFTFFCKTVPESLIEKLMNYKIKHRINILTYLSQKKWEYRKRGILYRPQRDYIYQNLERENTTENGCKRLPAEFISYVNILTMICPICPKSICSSNHLKAVHKLEIQTPEEIIEVAKRMWADERKRKKEKKQGLSREGILKAIANKCVSNLTKVKIFTRSI